MKKIIFQNLAVAFFFFSIQFIFGLLISYGELNSHGIIRVAIIAGTTTLLFIVIMALYQAAYIKKHKIAVNNFDLRPTQSLTFIVNKPVEDITHIIEDIIPQKINSSKFNYNASEGFYKATTSTTIRSWGEVIIIKQTQLESNKTKLEVLSKPVFKATIIDFGKSSSNIHQIKLAFN